MTISPFRCISRWRCTIIRRGLCRFAPLAPGAKIVSHLLRAKTTFVGFMSLKRIAKIVTVTECTPIGEKHKVDMLENPRCVSTKLDVVHVVCSSTAAVWSHQMFHLIINDTKHLNTLLRSYDSIKRSYLVLTCFNTTPDNKMKEPRIE